MINDELKKLRKEQDLTLKALSSRVGYGTGNLSSYENGKLRPKDPTLLRILIKGFRMSAKSAQATVAVWRERELRETYNLTLKQNEEPYNVKNAKKTLENFLTKEGLNKYDIKKVIKFVEEFKKKKGH